MLYTAKDEVLFEFISRSSSENGRLQITRTRVECGMLGSWLEPSHAFFVFNVSFLFVSHSIRHIDAERGLMDIRYTFLVIPTDEPSTPTKRTAAVQSEARKNVREESASKEPLFCSDSGMHGALRSGAGRTIAFLRVLAPLDVRKRTCPR